METRIDTLLAQVSDIETLLQDTQRHNDNVLATLKVKLDILKQQVRDIEKELNTNNITVEPKPLEDFKPIVKPEPKVEHVSTPEPKPEPKPVPKPEPARDIMATFSINDRFLFLRELFDGDEQRFNETISRMQGMSDINHVQNFMTDILNWNPSDDVVKEFTRIVSMSFKEGPKI